MIFVITRKKYVSSCHHEEAYFHADVTVLCLYHIVIPHIILLDEVCYGDTVKIIVN